MTNHKEWFSTVEKPKYWGVIETGYDTPHPIKHIKDVLVFRSLHMGCPDPAGKTR